MKYLKTFESTLMSDFEYTGKDLISAIKMDQIKKAFELINYGVDINYQNDMGLTPLIYAIMYNYIKIVRK